MKLEDMKELLTPEANQIFAHKVGYTRLSSRDMWAYADDVINYEVFDRYNKDIPTTLLKLYKDDLTKDQISILTLLSTTDELCFLELRDADTVDNYMECMTSIMVHLLKIYSCGNKCGWVYTKHDYETIYSDDINGINEHDIKSKNTIDIPDNILVLADTGSDGVLISC